MKFIPATFHGFLDYAVAVTLVAGPFLLGFEGFAQILAVAGGLGLFLYSLVTDYSTSVQKLLPFKVHLFFDFAAALVLIAAPFLLGPEAGFTGLATPFYVVIGAAVVLVVAVTNPEFESHQA